MDFILENIYANPNRDDLSKALLLPLDLQAYNSNTITSMKNVVYFSKENI